MNRDEYLFQFERWVGGSKQRKTRARAELDEHLDGAEQAGDLDSALTRLGDPRSAARDFTSGYTLSPAPLPRRFIAVFIDFLVLAILIGFGLAAGTWVPSRDDAIFPEDLVLEFGSENWYLTSFGGVGITLLALGGLWWIVILPLLSGVPGERWERRRWVCACMPRRHGSFVRTDRGSPWLFMLCLIRNRRGRSQESASGAAFSRKRIADTDSTFC